MAPVSVDVIRTTDPMVFLRAQGRPSRKLLIRVSVYDTVQQRTILPIQQMKAADMEMRKRIMVRIPNKGGEEEGKIMNPESSAGIYVTASVEDQYRLIAQNRNMKEEENIKNSKVNALKRTACMNQRAMLFAKLVANLPNNIMASEYPSTPHFRTIDAVTVRFFRSGNSPIFPPICL